MKITDFQEMNDKKKCIMEQKLAELKLEDIKSNWYFVLAKLKAVMGSKG